MQFFIGVCDIIDNRACMLQTIFESSQTTFIPVSIRLQKLKNSLCIRSLKARTDNFSQTFINSHFLSIFPPTMAMVGGKMDKKCELMNVYEKLSVRAFKLLMQSEFFNFWSRMETGMKVVWLLSNMVCSMQALLSIMSHTPIKNCICSFVCWLVGRPDKITIVK